MTMHGRTEGAATSPPSPLLPSGSNPGPKKKNNKNAKEQAKARTAKWQFGE
jgi:hypothetical protein